MSITSSRTVQIEFSGDTTLEVIQSALDNTTSPGISSIQSLTTGANVISPPDVTGIVPTGLMIIPPSGNTEVITLKGAASDDGIPLHLTDPTSLALDSGFSTFVLDVDDAVVGVRLIWS